ncbi:MAG: hypothetical protein E7256_12585 [Lachnospiraceae bacterium]|nr:hypothetical protein [Lachnospiraceae bacterium]
MEIGTDYKFGEIPYVKPDFDEIQEKVNELTERLRKAEAFDEVQKVLEDKKALEDDFTLMVYMAYIRSYQDCTDEFYQKEVQDVMPQMVMLDMSGFNDALIGSSYGEQIDRTYGAEFLEKIRTDNRLHTNGKELMAKEQELIAKYQQLKASMKISFDGKMLSEAELNKYRESLDRETRKNATEALYQALLADKEEYESILNELIHTRLAIAKANGFEDYLEYANMDMGRRGYGEKELQAFCDQVKRDLVPFIAKLKKEQAKRLGVTSLKCYDELVGFADGNPEPAGDDGYLTKAASRMYYDLSENMGRFFDSMLEHGLLDIKGTPNKIANMGFTVGLSKIKMPFVFGNCNGTSFDVTVLTHEVGHAYQGYLTMKEQKLNEYMELCNDIVEVPSKTMELFTLPYAKDFYGKDADKFQAYFMQEALEDISGYCKINEFESWMYRNPDAGIEEKAAEFERIARLYSPWLDNSDFAEYIKEGCMLFRNMAIYMFPKYVISYALSEMCAMQFKVRMEEDKKSTWEAYERLCAAGGSLDYPELLKLAGLSVAYEEGSVKRSTEYAVKWLEEHIKETKQD